MDDATVTNGDPVDATPGQSRAPNRHFGYVFHEHGVAGYAPAPKANL